MLKGELNIVDAVAVIAKDQEDLDRRRGVLLSLAHCFVGIDVEESLVEKVGAIDIKAFNAGLVRGKDIFESFYKTIFRKNYKNNPATINDLDPLSHLERSILIFAMAALGHAETEQFIRSEVNRFNRMKPKKQKRSSLREHPKRILRADNGMRTPVSVASGVI